MLLRKPSYGYELLQSLQEQCACQVDIGNLYRGLAKLEKRALLTKAKGESIKGPAKNIYTLTPAGKMYLDSWMQEIQHAIHTLTSLITHYEQLS